MGELDCACASWRSFGEVNEKRTLRLRLEFSLPPPSAGSSIWRFGVRTGVVPHAMDVPAQQQM